MERWVELHRQMIKAHKHIYLPGGLTSRQDLPKFASEMIRFYSFVLHNRDNGQDED